MGGNRVTINYRLIIQQLWKQRVFSPLTKHCLHGSMTSEVGRVPAPPASPRALRSFGSAESVPEPTEPTEAGVGQLISPFVPPSFATSNNLNDTGSRDAISLPSSLKLSPIAPTISPNSRNTQASHFRPPAVLPPRAALLPAAPAAARMPLGDKSNTAPEEACAPQALGIKADSVAQRLEPARPAGNGTEDSVRLAPSQQCDQRSGEALPDGRLQLPVAPACPPQDADTAKGPEQEGGARDSGSVAGWQSNGCLPDGAWLGCPATQVVLHAALPVAQATQVLMAEGTALPAIPATQAVGVQALGPAGGERQEQHGGVCLPDQERVAGDEAGGLAATAPVLDHQRQSESRHVVSSPGPECGSEGEGAARAQPHSRALPAAVVCAQEESDVPAAVVCAQEESDVPAALLCAQEESDVPAAAAGGGAAEPVPAAQLALPRSGAGGCQAPVGCPASNCAGFHALLAVPLPTADALAEAERVLRRQCLGPTQATPILLGTDTTVGSTQASWMHTEGVTQYQSLAGEDAAAQESLVAFARDLLLGEPSGSLKSVVCGEMVLDTSKVLLGPDYRKLHEGVTDRWQRVVWREFRRQGLDQLLSLQGRPALPPKPEPASPLAATAADEAEAQGFLCSEAEVEERCRQLAAQHRLSPLKLPKNPGRRHSTGSAVSAGGGVSPSPPLGRDSTWGGMTGSAKPAAMPAVHEGGMEQGEKVVGVLRPCSLEVEATLGEVVLPPATQVQIAMHACMGEGAGAAQDGSTAELDIQPTLCSPPPGLPQYQPAGLQRADGPSQLDIMPTARSMVSQLQQLPSSPSHPVGGAIKQATVAAVPAGAAPVPGEWRQQAQQDADPFDALLASQSQPSNAQRADAQVCFAGSWWFGAGDTRGSGEPTKRESATGISGAAIATMAAMPATALVDAGMEEAEQLGAAAGTAAQPAAAGALLLPTQQQLQQPGIVCSMVPDTPPDEPKPSSNSAGPAQQAVGGASVASPHATNRAPAEALTLAPAEPAVSGSLEPQDGAQQGQPRQGAPGTTPALGPPAAHSMQAQQWVWTDGAAGYSQGIAAPSQAVEERDVARAMEAVGLISSHFPTTQDWLPPRSRPAQQPDTLRQEPALHRVQAEQAVCECPLPAAVPLGSPSKRRWKRDAHQQEVPDSDCEEERPPAQEQRRQPAAAVVAAGHESGGWGRGNPDLKSVQPALGGAKVQSRQEQRKALVQGRMAPGGMRPDLASSKIARVLGPTPHRPLPAAAGEARAPGAASPATAAAAGPPRPPDVAAAGRVTGEQASPIPGFALQQAGKGGAGRQPQLECLPCSGLVDDVDLFSTQLHQRRLRLPASASQGNSRKAVANSPAAQVCGGNAADPFRCPSDDTPGLPTCLHGRQARVAAGRAPRTASLRELAKTAPGGQGGGTVERGGSGGGGTPRDGRQGAWRGRGTANPAHRPPQEGQGCEDEEQQLLVIEGPHPMIQTLPDSWAVLAHLEAAAAAATAVAASMQKEPAIQHEQGEGPEQQDGPSGGRRPTRHVKPPARYRNSPGKEGRSPRPWDREPRLPPVAATSPWPQQSLPPSAAKGSRGLKRAAPAADQPASHKKARPSPHQARRLEAPEQVVAPPRAGGAGLVPDSEDQVIAEYMSSHLLGCSKCRNSKGGCGKCRAERQAEIQGIIEARKAGLLARTAMSPGPRSHLKSAGAAAVGGLLAASPSPLTVHRGQKQGAGGRREQQEVEQEQEEEVPSQDMGAHSPFHNPVCGRAKPAAGRNPVAVTRPAAAAAALLDWAAPASGRRKSGCASGRVFEGSHFLVTGFGEALEQKRRLVGLIKQQGGRIVEDVPKPGVQGRRQSLGARSTAPITAVLCDRRLRTPKFLYAVIKGVPVVNATWVEDCIAVGKQVRAEGKYLVHPTCCQPGEGQEPVPAFGGVRVYLHGSRNFTHPFSQLLQHAGAVIASSIETLVPSAGTAGRMAAQSEAACDVLLMDDGAAHPTDSGGGAGEMSRPSLERLARRLRIPMHDREWAIQVLVQGRLPRDFRLLQGQAEATTPTLLGKAASGGASPALGSRGGPLPVHQPPSSGSHPGRTGSRGAVGSSDDNDVDQPGVGRLAGEEQKACTAVMPPPPPPAAAAAAAAPGAGSPHGGKRGRGEQQQDDLGEQGQPGHRPRLVHQDCHSCHMQPPAPQQQQQQQQAGSGGRGSPWRPQQQGGCNGGGFGSGLQVQGVGSSNGQRRGVGGSIAWVGGAQPPPPNLPATPFRTYYAAFIKDGEEVRVGDCVELAAAPGEEETRLAEVQALWGERAADGRERQQCRCRRFYRPKDTPHAGRDSHELFLSSHVEDCVALAAVLGTCTVLRQQPDQPLPAAPPRGTRPTYVCCYQYNCEDPSALRLLE